MRPTSRKIINWNLVKDTYSSWDDKTQQLNPVVGAVIAIAVGVATYGVRATAASIGGMASNATIAAGASAGAASTASVAAQAGFAF